MTNAIKRLQATARIQVALVSNSPVDDGVAEALEQNEKFAASLEEALKQFRADWCDKAKLVEEAETFARKHGGAKAEDVANECKATVGCFLKYLDVPEGTIDNVSLDNSEDDSGGKAVEDEEGDDASDDKDTDSEEDDKDED